MGIEKSAFEYIVSDAEKVKSPTDIGIRIIR